MKNGKRFKDIARSFNASYISIYPDYKIWRKIESPDDQFSSMGDGYAREAYLAFDDADLFEELLDYTCNVYEISSLDIFIVVVDADEGENTIFRLQNENRD